jgi:hypothetical protein
LSTGIFGDDILYLPKEFALGNFDEKYPEVSRIGNIMPDGSLKDSKYEGSIWH